MSLFKSNFLLMTLRVGVFIWFDFSVGGGGGSFLSVVYSFIFTYCKFTLSMTLGEMENVSIFNHPLITFYCLFENKVK